MHAPTSVPRIQSIDQTVNVRNPNFFARVFLLDEHCRRRPSSVEPAFLILDLILIPSSAFAFWGAGGAAAAAGRRCGDPGEEAGRRRGAAGRGTRLRCTALYRLRRHLEAGRRLLRRLHPAPPQPSVCTRPRVCTLCFSSMLCDSGVMLKTLLKTALETLALC